MHTITLEGNVKKENCLGLDVPSLTLGEVLKEPLFEVSSQTRTSLECLASPRLNFHYHPPKSDQFLS
jgi:hypothetical protein